MHLWKWVPSLRAGAAAVGNGRRFRILETDNEQGHPRVAVRLEGLQPATGVGVLLWFGFSLVNESQREALDMRQSYDFGDYDHSSHGMVLMGDSWDTTAGSLTFPRGVGSPPSEPPTVDDAWLAGAQLHITDWVSRGSFRLSTTPAAVEVRE